MRDAVARLEESHEAQLQMIHQSFRAEVDASAHESSMHTHRVFVERDMARSELESVLAQLASDNPAQRLMASDAELAAARVQHHPARRHDLL